jgi:hypothetical protein
MTSTTIKLTVATRDRIRSLGGETYEDTIVEALDALETERFWAQAEAAQAWRESLTAEHRSRILARDAEVDRLFDEIA